MPRQKRQTARQPQGSRRPTPPAPTPLRPVGGPASANPAAYRADQWQNAYTGLGRSDRDKRLGASFSPELLAYQQNEDLWVGDDMAARIVELLPDEMCREGWNTSIEEDRAASEAMDAAQDDLGVSSKVHEALCLARAFGGAGILLGADDGQNPEQPLDLERIRSLSWLTVLDAKELQPRSWYEDPGAAKYGEVETYRIHPLMVSAKAAIEFNATVHESRILRFEGVRTTRRRARRNWGWGDSVFVRVLNVLRDFAAAWDGAAHLLTDFSQGVLKIKGLVEILGSKDGAAILQDRMQAIDMGRSVLRSLLLDADGESFERMTTPLTGLEGLLDKFSVRLSAAAKTPMTLLLGQAPAGLSATGASDIRFWYDRVSAEQQHVLLPPLNRLTRVMFRARNGPTRGVEPANWSIQFKPLWQLTDTELADLRNKQADTDTKYLSAGVLTPEEVALSRFGGDQWSAETEIDTAAREALLGAQAMPAIPPSAALPAVSPGPAAAVPSPAGPAGSGAPPAPTAPGAPTPLPPVPALAP